MKVLITGVAGFIGMHVAELLLQRGDEVIGIDNFNDYYDVNLKESRIKILQKYSNFNFFKIDIVNFDEVKRLFDFAKPNRVVNLAAQAGVRYSIDNPSVYVQTNLVGFSNILECSRLFDIEHLVYASSSSVYGNRQDELLKITDNVDYPVSLYAATKKSNELMAYTYSHLYGIATTGLRYFTVYGPWGRPDMAPWLFTSAIIESREIKIFNNGLLKRDFTYISDIAEGTVLALDALPNAKKEVDSTGDDFLYKKAPYSIYNIGNGNPIEILKFVEMLENRLGIQAKKVMLPMQPGDVYTTCADISLTKYELNYIPKISFEEGIDNWVEWFKKYSKA